MTNPGMREQLQNEGAMPVGNSATQSRPSCATTSNAGLRL